MGLNKYSDYGSGSSSENYTPWGSQDIWPEFLSTLQEPDRSGRARSSSISRETGPRSLDAVMQEFRMNGFDSPYDPEQEEEPAKIFRAGLSGLGPGCQYLRQRSWPDDDASYRDRLREQQCERELRALPPAALQALLQRLQPRARNEEMECRFCKNNGERASYYRSHRLRSRGRVACPVLRAYTCRRCGARGDHAHTLKYCPLASTDERMKSAAMLHSVRMSSGRRRPGAPPAPCGPTSPLDPLWEALERKLMI